MSSDEVCVRPYRIGEHLRNIPCLVVGLRTLQSEVTPVLVGEVSEGLPMTRTETVYSPAREL